MNPTKTGAIFDVDGTLLDSMPVWDTVGADYLRSRGYEPDDRIGEVFRRMSLSEAAAYCRRVYGLTDTDEAFSAGIDARLEQFYRETAPLKQGAEAFLRRLWEEGIPLFLATATDRDLVEAALSRLGVLPYFSGLLTCQEVGKGKNEPAIYRRAAECLHTDRSHTFVFEDAFHAAVTAARDGFPVVGVYDPHEEQADALRAVADVYLTDFTRGEEFFRRIGR